MAKKFDLLLSFYGKLNFYYEKQLLHFVRGLRLRLLCISEIVFRRKNFLSL